MTNTKKPLLLTNVPTDVLNYLLKKQLDNKIEKKVRQYSLEQTIYNIIREQIK